MCSRVGWGGGIMGRYGLMKDFSGAASRITDN